MAEIYYDKDAHLSLIQGKKVAVIGYGSQGHAHALNLKESGVNVIVGLYPESKSRKVAEERGFKVMNTGDAVKAADVIMVAVPDTVIPTWTVEMKRTGSSMSRSAVRAPSPPRAARSSRRFRRAVTSAYSAATKIAFPSTSRRTIRMRSDVLTRSTGRRRSRALRGCGRRSGVWSSRAPPSGRRY